MKTSSWLLLVLLASAHAAAAGRAPAGGPPPRRQLQAIADPEAACAAAPDGGAPTTHKLPAGVNTTVWGYFYEGLLPKLVVASGDELQVEMITQHAGDDWARMGAGDPAVEELYAWGPNGQMAVPTRGANGRGDGVHLMTGPIYICDAEPGDVLQIDILDLQPRRNPATGRAFGSNVAANWGFQYRAGWLDGDAREIVTIYEAVEEGGQLYVVPVHSYRYSGGPTNSPGLASNCTADSGVVPDTQPGREQRWSNPGRQNYGGHLRLDGSWEGGVEVPCKDGKQVWPGAYFPGAVFQVPAEQQNTAIAGKFKIPARLHIGNIGLAPAYNTTVESTVPRPTGGNMDNWRIGAGTTLYLPVEVAGGLLSMGDVHWAQGDAELNGCGVEASANGKLRLTVHKQDSLPPYLEDLSFPLLETPDTFVTHGFSVADYLRQLPDPADIFAQSSLDAAMLTAFNQTRDFLMRAAGLTEDEAISAISLACDFGVTQVVDGNWAIHSIVPKAPFNLTGAM